MSRALLAAIIMILCTACVDFDAGPWQWGDMPWDDLREGDVIGSGNYEAVVSDIRKPAITFACIHQATGFWTDVTLEWRDDDEIFQGCPEGTNNCTSEYLEWGDCMAYTFQGREVLLC